MEPKGKLALFLVELRRSARALLIGLFTLTALIFALSSRVLADLQNHLQQTLYLFSVAGAFLAHVKISFFAALYLLMPWIMTIVWRALGQPFGMTGKTRFWFVFSTCLLFYLGTMFCYFVTLPYGVQFLLSFQSEHLQPVISVSRFVGFVTLFILAFGVIFELPVFMIFSARLGVSRKFFEKNRRFAILGIAIVAALLTPTPDVVNMALMGGPLYLLYEIGIMVIRIFKLDQKSDQAVPGGSKTLSAPSHGREVGPQ